MVLQGNDLIDSEKTVISTTPIEFASGGMQVNQVNANADILSCQHIYLDITFVQGPKV